jgi:hypothetical protein
MSDIAALFDKALDNARVAAERVTFPIRLAEKDAIQAKFSSPCRINPFDVPLAEKVAFLKEMDEKLNQPGVLQRVSELIFMRKQSFHGSGSETECHHGSILTPVSTKMTRGRPAKCPLTGKVTRLNRSTGSLSVNARIVRGDEPGAIATLSKRGSIAILPPGLYLQTHEQSVMPQS